MNGQAEKPLCNPEFLSSLVRYLEWGTRMAVNNSSLTENPMTHSEPMPSWGWGETKGALAAKGGLTAVRAKSWIN